LAPHLDKARKHIEKCEGILNFRLYALSLRLYNLDNTCFKIESTVRNLLKHFFKHDKNMGTASKMHGKRE
jgi:hypothetical protein